MSNVPDSLSGDGWQQLNDDAEAVADEYRSDGWDVSRLTPGDITVVEEGERRGLSVLVPDDQYDAVEHQVWQTDIAFNTSDVFRRVAGGQVLTLLVQKATTAKRAVVIPLSYTVTDLESVVDPGAENEKLRVHVRPLTVDEWVTFTQSDPALFLPE
jgi:hypothetical protein